MLQGTSSIEVYNVIRELHEICKRIYNVIDTVIINKCQINRLWKRLNLFLREFEEIHSDGEKAKAIPSAYFKDIKNLFLQIASHIESYVVYGPFKKLISNHELELIFDNFNSKLIYYSFQLELQNLPFLNKSVQEMEDQEDREEDNDYFNNILNSAMKSDARLLSFLGRVTEPEMIIEAISTLEDIINEDIHDPEAHPSDLPYEKNEEGHRKLVYSEAHSQEILSAIRNYKKPHMNRKKYVNIDNIVYVCEHLKHMAQGLTVESKNWQIASWDIEIWEILSVGPFSKIYKAFWLGLDVAIKEMSYQINRVRVRKEFYKDVKMWYNLHHPNVLSLYGAYQLGDYPFVVIPLMKNGNLISYIEGKEKLSLLNLIEILIGISSGMEYLHSKNVVHGDLMARNILLDEKLQPHICDFGFSKCRAVVDHHSKLKRLDSLRWTANEVHESFVYTKKSDVYSFAMLCYELFTWGNVPFQNLSERFLSEAVISGKRPDYPEECPKPIWRLMEKMWDGRPEARPNFTDITRYLVKFKEQLTQKVAQKEEVYVEAPASLASASSPSSPSSTSPEDINDTIYSVYMEDKTDSPAISQTFSNNDRQSTLSGVDVDSPSLSHLGSSTASPAVYHAGVLSPTTSTSGTPGAIGAIGAGGAYPRSPIPGRSPRLFTNMDEASMSGSGSGSIDLNSTVSPSLSHTSKNSPRPVGVAMPGVPTSSKSIAIPYIKNGHGRPVRLSSHHSGNSNTPNPLPGHAHSLSGSYSSPSGNNANTTSHPASHHPLQYTTEMLPERLSSKQIHHNSIMNAMAKPINVVQSGYRQRSTSASASANPASLSTSQTSPHLVSPVVGGKADPTTAALRHSSTHPANYKSRASASGPGNGTGGPFYITTSEEEALLAMDPMDPMGPMGPMGPMNPLDPLDPMNFIDPLDPMNPLDPLDAMDPMDPMNPMDPMDPRTPYTPKNSFHPPSGYDFTFKEMEEEGFYPGKMYLTRQEEEELDQEIRNELSLSEDDVFSDHFFNDYMEDEYIEDGLSQPNFNEMEDNYNYRIQKIFEDEFEWSSLYDVGEEDHYPYMYQVDDQLLQDYYRAYANEDTGNYDPAAPPQPYHKRRSSSQGQGILSIDTTRRSRSRSRSHVSAGPVSARSRSRSRSKSRTRSKPSASFGNANRRPFLDLDPLDGATAVLSGTPTSLTPSSGRKLSVGTNLSSEATLNASQGKYSMTSQGPSQGPSQGQGAYQTPPDSRPSSPSLPPPEEGARLEEDHGKSHSHSHSHSHGHGSDGHSNSKSSSKPYSTYPAPPISDRTEGVYKWDIKKDITFSFMDHEDLDKYYPKEEYCLSNLTFPDIDPEKIPDPTFTTQFIEQVCKENPLDKPPKRDYVREMLLDIYMKEFKERFGEFKFDEIIKKNRIEFNTYGFSDWSYKRSAYKVLIDIIKYTFIKHLYIRNCRFGDPAIIALANALTANGEFTVVDITFCSKRARLQQENNIMDIIKYDASNLDPSWVLNNNVTSKSGQLFANLIHQSKNMKAIHLRNAAFGNDCAMMMANALRKNKTIEDFELCNCLVNDTGAMAFADMLKHNKVLLRLILQQNPIGDKGAIAISSALRKNMTLKYLLLQKCGMSAKSMSAFTPTLLNNTGLELVKFSSNNIGNDGARSIAEGIIANSNIKQLWIDDCNISKKGIQAISKALDQNNFTEIHVGSVFKFWEKKANFNPRIIIHRDLFS